MAGAGLSLKDLATESGARTFVAAMRDPEGRADLIKRIASSYLTQNPAMAATRLGKSKGGAFYDFDRNALGVASANPHVLAHEMGHAHRLAEATEGYKSLLKGSKAAVRLGNVLAMPISLVIAANKQLELDTKNKALAAIAVGAGLAAAPNLFEELAASAHAVHKSPTKIRTAINMLPSVASHSLHDLTAPGTALAVRTLLNTEGKS